MECVYNMNLFLLILLLTLMFIFYSKFCNRNGVQLINWPLIGMLPSIINNIQNFHGYILQILDKYPGLTFTFKGPWFTNMDMIFTMDPSNVHHVLSKHFAKYDKGSKLNEIFDIFGETIITVNNHEWVSHRKLAQSLFVDPRFHKFYTVKTWSKVENDLISVLDYVSMEGLEVDLQDLFTRIAFDLICTMVIGHDPRSLSTDFRKVPYSDAFDDVGEAIFCRFFLPKCIWKLQRWLGVGKEKKHIEAWRTLDMFVYECIARRKEGLHAPQEEDGPDADFMTLVMEGKDTNFKITDKFLRDNVLTLLYAGRETTAIGLSWLFYLLFKNPQVLSKIREEIDEVSLSYSNNHGSLPETSLQKIADKLVYLDGAIREALRLYPPVAFETKAATELDTLPSGQRVYPNMHVVFCLTAMGRSRSVWGEDCLEFKPERWISEKGAIRHVSPFKFLAFNAGPRICLGKNVAFTEMKAVAATIIKNYSIEPVEGHPIVPAESSFIHRMKYGFKVKIVRQ